MTSLKIITRTISCGRRPFRRELPQRRQKRAREIGGRIIAALDYVGVIGIELFVAGDDVIVNEIAPRVHNSGHWTMDACSVSQFEQHIRAICGWPLGSPERHSDVVMTNLLGDEVNAWRTLAAEPGTALHLYGKAEARRGRKMGHFNRADPSTGLKSCANPPPHSGTLLGPFCQPFQP